MTNMVAIGRTSRQIREVETDEMGNLFISTLASSVGHSSAPNRVTVNATPGGVVLLAANANRLGFSIQQAGTSVIKVTLGPTAPTQTVYHFALAAGGTQDDGSGVLHLDFTWTGLVQAISSVDGGAVVITEFT